MKKQTFTLLSENFYRLEENQTFWGRKKLGKKNYKKCFGPDHEVAEAEVHGWLASLLKNKPQSKNPSELTLADGARMFVAWKQDAVGDTIRQYTVDKLEETFQTVNFYWPPFSEIQISKLTQAGIRDMRNSLKTAVSQRTHRQLSRQTVSSYCAPVKTVLRYLAGTAKLISWDHFNDLSQGFVFTKRAVRTVQIPTPDQLLLMRSYLRRHVYGKGRKRKQIPYMADMLFLYGSRIDMLRRLKVEHIDFVRNKIRFFVNKQPLGSPDTGELPLLPEAEFLLREYIQLMGLKPGDYLFTIKTIHRSLKKAAALAGISNWYHHACRKYVGTKLIQEGVDIPTVAEFLFQSDHGKTLLEHYRMACSSHMSEVMSKRTLLPGVHMQLPEWVTLTRPLVETAISRIFAAEPETAKPILEAVIDVGNALASGDTGQALSRLRSSPSTHLQPGWSQGMPRCMTTNQDQSRITLANNLRYLLLSNGLSIPDASRGSGVPKHIFYEIRTCRYSGTDYWVEKLATFFHVPKEYFFNANNPKLDSNRVIENFRILTARYGHASFARPSLVGQVVTGNNLPPGDLLRSMSEFLGISITQLITEDLSKLQLPEPRPTEPADTPTLDRKAAGPNLVANLEFLLLLHGLLATEASRLMGMNSYDLPRYARGQNFPQRKAIEVMAKFFKTTPEALCGPPPKLDPVQIGIYLSALIASKQISANALAVALNIHPERLQQTLSGKKLPCPRQFKRMVEFFGIAPLEILTRRISAPAPNERQMTFSLPTAQPVAEQPAPCPA